MTNLFEFTSGAGIFGPDDFNFITSLFEFTSDTNNYALDDFSRLNRLFTFDAPPVAPPNAVYFSFDVAPHAPPPPTGTFDPGTPIILSFRDPRALNPFMAKHISGLDASKIKPKYYKGTYGDIFYNLTLESRELVILIGLNPNYKRNQSGSDLRDLLYKVMSYSRTGEVTLYFKNGNTVVATLNGFATKIDTTLFEQNQEIELTIDCEDPVFRAPKETVLNVELFGSDISIDDPDSTAPHGFSFQLEFNTAAPDLEITDPEDPSWMFKVTPSGGFLNGDVLYFSSEPTNRQLYLVRSLTTIDLMSKVSLTSVWPIIFPGVNNFSLSPLSSLAITWQTLSYRKAYWGV